MSPDDEDSTQSSPQTSFVTTSSVRRGRKPLVAGGRLGALVDAEPLLPGIPLEPRLGVEDLNEPGPAVDLNEPGPVEDYTKTASTRRDDPTPDGAFLVQDAITGATFAGSSFVDNSFAVEADARRLPDAEQEDDGTYSIDQPFPDLSEFDDFEFEEPPEPQSNGRRAYFIDGQRYTPSQLRKLSRRRKIEAMIEWFHDNYEDPAVRTSYVTAEGGYQWVGGGPYDAREQIGDQFGDIADEEAIEAAAQKVEEDGLVDWAPKASPDDYDPPDEPDDVAPARQQAESTRTNFSNGNFSNLTFGAGVGEQHGEVEAFRAMHERLDGLEALIRQQISISPNRGHNRPPELLDIERPVSEEQFQEVIVAIADIRQESESPTPQLVKVVEKVSVLRRIAGLIKISVLFVGGAAASGPIGDIASDTYKAHQHQLYQALVYTSEAVMACVTRKNRWHIREEPGISRNSWERP